MWWLPYIEGVPISLIRSSIPINPDTTQNSLITPHRRAQIFHAEVYSSNINLTKPNLVSLI